MSDDLVKVTVSDGKYTFVQKADGSCYALRYDEPWREGIFDGMTLAMAYRIEELEAKLAKAVEALDEAIYLLDPDEEDIAKKTGLHRIVTAYEELTGDKDEY